MIHFSRKTLVFLITIFLFLIFLTCLRIGWISTHQIEQDVESSKGTIDLSRTNLKDRILTLNGEWNFYEGEFLHEIHLNQDDSKTRIVPETWNNEKTDKIVYATYHLQLKLNKEDVGKRLALRFPLVHSATNISINGEQVGSNGTLSLNEKEFKGSRLPFTVDFITDQPEVDILVHVGSKGEWKRAGIASSIYLGSEKVIDRQVTFSIFNQLIVSVIFFIYSIYGIFLYFNAGKRKIFCSFFFLALLATLSVLVSDDMLIFQFFPVTYEMSIRIGLVTYALLALYFVIFFKVLLPKYDYQTFSRWFIIFCVIYITFLCFSPIGTVIHSRLCLTFILLISGILVGKQVIDMLKNEEKHAIYFLLITICFIENIIWAFIRRITTIDYSFYPFNFILITILFSMFWIKQYFDSLQKKENLSKELQKNLEKKDEFLVNTSHELRNPLHAIINIARSLQQENIEQKTEEIKGITLISSVGEQMALLLDNLLDISLLRENMVNLNLQKVYLQSIAPGVIQIAEFLARNKNVFIINNIPPQLPALHADESKIIQILFNLLQNAVDYTEKGTIVVSANYEENFAFIQIKDTGIGMSDELQKKIFNRYERGDSSLSAKNSGIGLGLNISKGLVELHGGTIFVKSELSKGTTFTFSIPLAKENEEIIAPPPIEEKDIPTLSLKPNNFLEFKQNTVENRPKILAVDDDSLNLDILQSILKNEYDICCVSSGKEALHKIKQETWDLIISDVMMPNISGYELTSLIRKRYSLTELPVVLLTAIHKSMDVINMGLNVGANDYLIKPVSDIELKARIRSLVHLKRSTESKLQMEAAWLQAQVEPHFLFNTISSIMILFEQDIERGKALMEYFTTFLQTSYQFHNSSRLVPFEKEVELVNSYLYIMKERFPNKLDYTVHCDEEAKKYVLPPLTIQPLVENAVKHGIMSKIGDGKVEVIIRKKEMIEITIRDNGRGIDPEKIEKIQNQEYKMYSGIGLRNVIERLKGHYGTGIDIKSTDREGTIIKVSLPAIRSIHSY